MTILNTTKPNPGSDEAVKIGCLCPVIDNHYGHGYQGEEGVFVYNSECPIHTITLDELRMRMGITKSQD